MGISVFHYYSISLTAIIWEAPAWWFHPVRAAGCFETNDLPAGRRRGPEAFAPLTKGGILFYYSGVLISHLEPKVNTPLS
jgi:hypothetical protein